MIMAYRTGVYTAPTANNPLRHVAGPFFRSVLEPALTAAGYTKVRDFTSDNTVYRHVVFTTPTGAPAPFALFSFIDPNYNASQGNLYMTYMSKPYDTTTKTFSGLAPTSTNAYAYDSTGFNTAATFNADNISDNYVGSLFGLPDTGFEYWASITRDHMVLGIRVGSAETTLLCVALSPVTPAGSHADANWARSTSAESYWSSPGEPGITAAGGPISFFGMTATNVHSYSRDAFSPTRVLSQMYLRHRFGSDVRGSLRDVPYLYSTTFANGDTVTEADGSVRVLLRVGTNSSTFYAVDTENN
jgi:hypothetical protein